MASSVAVISTSNSTRYLQQLCKHWAHRFAATWDAAAGEVNFGDGQSVKLAAGANTLNVSVADVDPARLPKLEKVVADHLTRFAFRESLTFDWVRQ